MAQNGAQLQVEEPEPGGCQLQNSPPLASFQSCDALKQVRSTQTSRRVQDPELLWDNKVLTDADLLG